MDQERKPILGDSTIIWPGTKVLLSDEKHNGETAVVLYSNRYGEEYCVTLENNVIIKLKKKYIEEDNS